MSTILFNEIVFGPVDSRRLGSSLGINLLPEDGKVCSFDCIYCECGLNKNFRTSSKLPDRKNVYKALKERLISLKEKDMNIDVITFAGNGEPTIHSEFEGIIDDTIKLRDHYYPKALISVLSNGTQLHRPQVFAALRKTDKPVLKLDSAFDETVKLLNRPNSPSYSVAKQLELYREFNGDFILQTMFIEGELAGVEISNSSEREISAWLDIVQSLNPREVMIYTFDRSTPIKGLRKTSLKTLHEIAERVEKLGIKTSVAG